MCAHVLRLVPVFFPQLALCYFPCFSRLFFLCFSCSHFSMEAAEDLAPLALEENSYIFYKHLANCYRKSPTTHTGEYTHCAWVCVCVGKDKFGCETRLQHMLTTHLPLDVCWMCASASCTLYGQGKNKENRKNKVFKREISRLKYRKILNKYNKIYDKGELFFL